MSYRKTIFGIGQFYHIFNRSVGRETIFRRKRNISRAIEMINYYRFTPSLSFSKFLSLPEKNRQEVLKILLSTSPHIEIYAFSLMPNHYHFLVKQLEEEGIRNFITNFQNSYARYFNIKDGRHGALFCHPFKGVRIENEWEFLHVSRYIHLNPVTSYLIEAEELFHCTENSFGCYLGEFDLPFITKDMIFNHFKSIGSHRKFVLDQVDYQRSLKKIKDLLLESKIPKVQS